MKFPTYKELGEIAAKEALDTFEYNGKTLREWIEIISAAELGTNLAEVGTDLVSRQAVKDIFTELYGISAIGSVFDKYEWADICETTANELLSAQPERKTGRWILVASGRGGYECSCCHEYAPSYRCGEDRLSNFCPNCGADMRPTERNSNV